MPPYINYCCEEVTHRGFHKKLTRDPIHFESPTVLWKKLKFENDVENVFFESRIRHSCEVGAPRIRLSTSY